MVAQKGKDLLLKVDPLGSGLTTVAGLRARKVSLNAEIVDVTDSESAGRWRELLSGSGVRRASITGSGIFKDAHSDELVRSIFFEDKIVPWSILVPDFGTIDGAFQITSLEYSGQHDNEVSFDIALESAGELSFGSM